MMADIFVFPSIREGLPMALVEALFMQVPAVCYDVNGIKEVLKDQQNGFLCKSKDYKTMAKNICTILDGKFNFTAIDLSDFDINIMVQKQANLYQNLLKN